MHKALEHKFFKRTVLTNSHKFLTRIKISLYGIHKVSESIYHNYCSMKCITCTYMHVYAVETKNICEQVGAQHL